MKPSYPLLASLLLAAGTAMAASPVIEMYKHEGCGCCGLWAAHLEKSGFEVRSRVVADVGVVRRGAKVPDAVRSCHTAFVDGYAIEGHVPASAIKRLLRQRPNAVGLAVAGMPGGSPGMESAPKVPYEVLLVLEDGSTRVYSRH